LVEEQYYLSKYAGISLTESAMLSDFEREAFLNLVIKQLKEEIQAQSNIKTAQ